MIRAIMNRFSTMGNVVTESLMKDYSSYTERNFVDRLKIKVFAGHGGKGCVTYHRDRSVRTGAPDGGNGGKGGDVFFQASKTKYDLNHLKKPSYFGNNAYPGRKGKSDGKNGKDVHIQVPIGTLIYEVEEVEGSQDKGQISSLKKIFIDDLDWDGKSIMVAKGGRGGKGNGDNVGIREAQPELKCLADIGLVGYPNAGKSTFLASVTRALPKIAEYPFTTLNPMIGRVKFIDNSSFTIADLPGIIHEAHKDKGLGLDFLRHIERTKILIFMVDLSEEQKLVNEVGPTLSPVETINILKDEIKHYNPKILEKPQIIVANKCDLEKQSLDIFRKLQEKNQETQCFMISAKHGYNIGQVVAQCKNMIDSIREQEKEEMNQKKQADLKSQRQRELLEKELIGQ